MRITQMLSREIYHVEQKPSVGPPTDSHFVGKKRRAQAVQQLAVPWGPAPSLGIRPHATANQIGQHEHGTNFGNANQAAWIRGQKKTWGFGILRPENQTKRSTGQQ